jgi:hypothetical protein
MDGECVQVTTLITVMGATDATLVRHFLDHYRGLGVERFLVGVHFGPGTGEAQETETLGVLRDLVEGGPRSVGRGQWLAGTNGQIRDRLRAEAGDGWHLFADVDEFQYYPEPLADVLVNADDAGEPTIEGLLYDRVSSTGALSDWTDETGLDHGYPLGGFLTGGLLEGDPRKVMAARAEVAIGAGNHWAPGLRVGPAAPEPLPVYHFKWRAGCREYLENRIRAFTDSHDGSELSMAAESIRLLRHLESNGGRIDVSPSGPVAYRPCNLTEPPEGWSRMIEPIMQFWWHDRWTRR